MILLTNIFIFKGVHEFNMINSKYVVDNDLKYIDDIFFSEIYEIKFTNFAFYVYNTIKDILNFSMVDERFLCLGELEKYLSRISDDK